MLVIIRIQKISAESVLLIYPENRYKVMELWTSTHIFYYIRTGRRSAQALYIILFIIWAFKEPDLLIYLWVWTNIDPFVKSFFRVWRGFLEFEEVSRSLKRFRGVWRGFEEFEDSNAILFIRFQICCYYLTPILPFTNISFKLWLSGACIQANKCY